MSATRKVRAVRVAPSDAVVRRGTNGAVYMQSGVPLGPYQTRITDSLDHWAAHAPDRTFLAQRDDSVAAGLPPSREASADRRSLGEGGQARVDTTRGWRRLNYGDALTRVRRIAQALLDRKLSLDRPIVILSGNGIDHGLLALAAMYVGVPYAPIAPAYSLQARDYVTLRQVFDRMRPGLVFVADGARFERPLGQVMPAGVELVVSASPPEGLPATSFAALAATPITDAVDA